jgi:hypothetical protein
MQYVDNGMSKGSHRDSIRFTSGNAASIDLPIQVTSENSNEDKENWIHDHLPAPSTLEGDDQVSDQFVLYHRDMAALTDLSEAVIKRTYIGVVSFDLRIDRDPDQLWQYFMTYLNEKPRQYINIHGYHTEVNIWIDVFYAYDHRI